MNDVNLNNPDLRLVRSGDRAPAKALSSSQAGDGKASVPAASGSNGSAVQSQKALAEVSNADKLRTQSELHQDELNGAVSQLNDFVQNVQRDLQFEVDSEMGQTIVKVVDQSTQEVIRQIPDEVAVRLAEKLQQDEPLTLFNIKV